MKKIILTLACLLPLVSFGGITVGSSLPAGVVTNRYGATNVIQLNDYYHLYVTGSTNPLANGCYSWLGYENTNGIDWLGCDLMTNGIGTPIQQRFSRIYTNGNGFALVQSTDSQAYNGSLGLDFCIFSSTNIDWVTVGNLCYVSGLQYTTFDSANNGDQFVEVATNWNTELSLMFLEGIPSLYGPPYPIVKWGTNTIFNVPTTSSFETNRIINVDAVCGDDTNGAIGGRAFKTVQVAQAISELNGENFTWNIAAGNYHLFDYRWCPSNAVINAASDAVFYNQGQRIQTIFNVYGNLIMHGGKIYQQLNRGVFGPVAGYGHKALGMEFYGTKFFAEHGTMQGTSASIIPVLIDGCEFWSGSWSIEPVGAGADLIVKNTTVHQNSWNLEPNGTGMYPIAVAVGTTHVVGCSLITSNSYPQSYTADASVFVVNNSSNQIHIAGTTFQHIGSNTNWLFLKLGTNSSTYLYGLSLATNRITGNAPQTSQQ